MKRSKNILFLADREDGLDAALDRVVAVSRTNSARLTVMDVTPDAGFDSYLRRTYAVDLNARLREQRLESLESLTRPYRDAGVPVYTTVAREQGIDLVVMGTLGSIGIPGLFIGNIAEDSCAIRRRRCWR